MSGWALASQFKRLKGLQEREAPRGTCDSGTCEIAAEEGRHRGSSTGCSAGCTGGSLRSCAQGTRGTDVSDAAEGDQVEINAYIDIDMEGGVEAFANVEMADTPETPVATATLMGDDEDDNEDDDDDDD